MDGSGPATPASIFSLKNMNDEGSQNDGTAPPFPTKRHCDLDPRCHCCCKRSLRTYCPIIAAIQFLTLWTEYLFIYLVFDHITDTFKWPFVGLLSSLILCHIVAIITMIFGAQTRMKCLCIIHLVASIFIVLLYLPMMVFLVENTKEVMRGMEKLGDAKSFNKESQKLWVYIFCPVWVVKMCVFTYFAFYSAGLLANLRLKADEKEEN